MIVALAVGFLAMALVEHWLGGNNSVWVFVADVGGLPGGRRRGLLSPVAVSGEAASADLLSPALTVQNRGLRSGVGASLRDPRRDAQVAAIFAQIRLRRYVPVIRRAGPIQPPRHADCIG